MRLKEWFAKNKFQAKTYKDLDRLVKKKKENEETISVVIPTLNEEETVGEIIDIIQSELMGKEKNLVDEIVVVDSGSKDDTEKIVKEKGVGFYKASEILKRYNDESGKGENLWKSLYVTKGSILVFLDGDLQNMDAKFVKTLAGPLLTHSKFKLIKSYFKRTLNETDDSDDVALGGGRVTELLVRPLLNMYFPQLTGFIQPLSGQIAARRSLLERLTFFTGYGVDLGLMIDTFKTYDLENIAQVNLGFLQHSHHTLEALSNMAFSVLQVFSARAHMMGKLIMTDEIRKKYKIVKKTKEKDRLSYSLRGKVIVNKQRPPMITISAYRKKFDKSKEQLINENEK